MPGGITAGALFELMMWGGSLLTSLPVSLYNIYRYCDYYIIFRTSFGLLLSHVDTFRAYRDGTGKNRTLWEGNRPLVCPFLFFTLTTVWVLASPTNILERDPRCFTFMVGIVFSNICCQLIVAQMSNTRCEVFSWLLVPVGAVVAAAIILPSSLHLELPLLYLLTAFTFLAHVHYGVCLVSSSPLTLIHHLN